MTHNPSVYKDENEIVVMDWAGITEITLDMLVYAQAERRKIFEENPVKQNVLALFPDVSTSRFDANSGNYEAMKPITAKIAWVGKFGVDMEKANEHIDKQSGLLPVRMFADEREARVWLCEA